MRTTYGVGNAAASEGDLLCIPRLYKRDGTKTGVVFCHNLGGTAVGPVLDSTQTNFQRILRAIVDIGGFPLISTDLGGAVAWNNDTVMTRIGQAITWLQTASSSGGGGAKSGKVCLFGWSMGGPSMVRYAADNPTSVACLVGLQPVSDLDDFRNFNRPTGWSGTTPLSPFNGRGINIALGLAQDSTGDYPTHGTSLTTLPTGTDPTLHHPTGIPAKAWYSTDDITVIPATVTTLWQTLMGGTVVPCGTGGHGDAGLAGVDERAVAQFIATNQT